MIILRGVIRMVKYIFDISKINRCIKEYLIKEEGEREFEEFREFIVLSLLEEYELPLNTDGNLKRNMFFNKHKQILFNKYFHEFACTYSNMYSSLLNMLGDGKAFTLVEMKVESNILILKVEGGYHG